jgi:uncharacterized protein (TIGR03437 family)
VKPLYLAVISLFSFSIYSSAQVTQLLCDATAEPAQVRSEGLTERLGAIVLTCDPVQESTLSVGTISLVVSSPVTNRLAGEVLPEVVMTAETSAGRQPVGGTPRLISSNVIAFDAFSFTLPLDKRTAFRITGIRAAVNGLPENTQVTVYISTSGQPGIGVRQNPVVPGIVRRGLLANSSSLQIVCQGSPLPEDIDFGSFLAAGTRYFTMRVTEGSFDGFQVRQPGATNGTRILVRYSGWPSGARLFVPDVIAGSSATQQTSAGDLGVPASGGRYSGPTGGLVLSRVKFADEAGAGDQPGFAPAMAPGTVTFNGVSEVRLVNGEGSAVYEAVDENPNILESAHIPTFVALRAQNDGRNQVAFSKVTFGPLSTIRAASSSAPLTRFIDTPPQLDCSVLRDCNASYFPRLMVDPQPLTFRAPAKINGFYSKYVRVVNEGGGLLNWATKIQYQNGSNWLSAFPESGINTASLNLSAHPENLEPGFYRATFTVDAGPLAGSKTYNVTMEVFTPPPAKPEPPAVREFGNAASLRVDKLVPGSLGTLKGERLGGAVVSVTFDGIVATLLFQSDTQINLLVPAQLAGRPVAQMQVTRDGIANTGQLVTLSPTAPGIFPGGILNQDGFPNAPNNPALVGSIFQVFATGLPLPGQGKITAKIHDREIEVPLYGGPAPGLNGVQQVNFAIPADLPAMTSEVLVCGAADSDPARRVCSPPAPVVLRRLD